ncbi:MAG TPA: sigma-54 dependent transcriptional regulator [Candidatus Binataceae bacterium]|jgi:DNA-binding NtrC family response regulator|nr:sigma-54 dependent transcriptional regulator [Candidatus Binataceae bacterium]
MEGERDTIVVVDDDREMSNVLVEILGAAGYRALAANSGAEALNLVRREHLALVISDLRMVGMSGHQLQAEIKRLAPNLPVVIITAFGSIQTAVESMKMGAFDYITKPFANDELLLVVSRALEDRNLRQEIRRLRGELAHSYGLENIIAVSRKMSEVLEIVGQIADSAASVLVAGESGTGKELIARALHFRSRRQQEPFVPVNCAAIPDNLLESELFGHVKGAFTDARQAKTGLFQAARAGTLFLDEVGEMPLLLQTKLLRVIEDKRVRPVGATDEIPVDVRIVSATNSDLEEAIAAGKFRADLYYRLATVTLVLPPLRDRPEDIGALVKHFLARASAEAARPVPEIDAEAMACLMHHQWPGNIRELQNAISRAVILCRNGRITRSDLPGKMAGGEAQSVTVEDAVNRRLTMDQLEREYARAIVAAVGGNKSEAAAVLGIDRKTLYRKLGEPESN